MYNTRVVKQNKYKSMELFEMAVRWAMKKYGCEDPTHTFTKCMSNGAVVVVPISKTHPRGVVAKANLYRTEVQFVE